MQEGLNETILSNTNDFRNQIRDETVDFRNLKNILNETFRAIAMSEMIREDRLNNSVENIENTLTTTIKDIVKKHEGNETGRKVRQNKVFLM